jgi:hypothetical protein
MKSKIQRDTFSKWISQNLEAGSEVSSMLSETSSAKKKTSKKNSQKKG